jgi:glucose/arabinose dehydrogenase
MRLARHLLSAAAALVLALGAPALALAQLEPGAPASNFTLAPWLDGVNNVTDIAFLKDGRAVVTRKQGEVILVGLDGRVLFRPAAQMTVDSGSEKGLLGVVSDDADNLYFYASTGGDNADKHKVYKGRVEANGTVTIDMARPIVTGGLEGPANHDGGGMVIHENQLYIGVGDTGSNRTPPQNKYGSCLNKPNGKILRVNLDGSIPGDNPLANVAMATSCTSTLAGSYEMAPPDRRIYAWGFRNPWRLWIDPMTDLMWIGDVGETNEEEVTVGGKGTHHGYPFVEGARTWGSVGGLAGCAAMTPSVPCTPPQDRYPHDQFRGSGVASVTGGLIPPAGCGWGAYEQKYFFGDYNRDTIWTLDVKPDRSGAVEGSRKLFASIAASNEQGPVSFRMGPDGAMYIAQNNPGAVLRLAPKTIPAGCATAAPSPADGGAGTGGSGAGTGGDGGCGCDLGAGGGRASGAFGLLLAAAGWAATLVGRRRRRRAG